MDRRVQTRTLAVWLWVYLFYHARAKNRARRCGGSATPCPLCRLSPPSIAGEVRVNPSLLTSPGQRLPGWSMQAEEANPPPLTTITLDPDSSHGPRLAPGWPSGPRSTGEPCTPCLFWLGRDAYLPPQSFQPSCLPCKQPNAPHHHLEARGRLPRGPGRPRPV